MLWYQVRFILPMSPHHSSLQNQQQFFFKAVTTLTYSSCILPLDKVIYLVKTFFLHVWSWIMMAYIDLEMKINFQCTVLNYDVCTACTALHWRLHLNFKWTFNKTKYFFCENAKKSLTSFAFKPFEEWNGKVQIWTDKLGLLTSIISALFYV